METKKPKIGQRLRQPKWDLNSLPPIEKNFYREHSNVSRRSEADSQRYREIRDIRIRGRNVPKPVFSFEESNFPQAILSLIAEEKFTEPTPIQTQSWPVCLAARDLVAIAETGSGKTLGYLLPGLVHTQHQPYVGTEVGPIVLILTPTRELAIQVRNYYYY